MARLPRVREPVETKRHFYEGIVLRRDRATEAALKQGTWFTKPYWDSFKPLLRAQGVTWQILMEVWGMASRYFLRWARGEMSWEEALDELEKAVNEVLARERRGTASPPEARRLSAHTRSASS